MPNETTWKVGDKQDAIPNILHLTIRASDGFIIAWVNKFAASLNDKRDEANAHLIAAAPDLLFALKELLYHTERKGDANKFLAVAKAENAIRKAEGR